MLQRYFNLHLTPGYTVPTVINVNQYDEAEAWIFTLYESIGVRYVPDSAFLVGAKPDGTYFSVPGSIKSDGQVEITEIDQITDVSGCTICELRIDNDTHGTANFFVIVEKSPIDIPREAK